MSVDVEVHVRVTVPTLPGGGERGHLPRREHALAHLQHGRLFVTGDAARVVSRSADPGGRMVGAQCRRFGPDNAAGMIERAESNTDAGCPRLRCRGGSGSRGAGARPEKAAEHPAQRRKGGVRPADEVLERVDQGELHELLLKLGDHRFADAAEADRRAFPGREGRTDAAADLVEGTVSKVRQLAVVRFRGVQVELLLRTLPRGLHRGGLGHR